MLAERSKVKCSIGPDSALARTDSSTFDFGPETVKVNVGSDAAESFRALS